MQRFQLAPLFRSGAVLCRNKEIRLFGTAEEGLALTLTLTAEKNALLARDTATARDGRFCFRLPPQQANTNCALTLSDGQETTVYSDIAIGDVYLAGGQSNMELELQNADEGKALYPVHENNRVRYFNVPKYARFSDEMEQANENSLPYLKDIYGRKRDCIYTTDGKLISPAKVFVLMWGIEGVKQWQFIQKTQFNYVFKVNAEKDADLTPAIDRLRNLLGDDAIIDIELVDEIPVLSSNKRIAVKCEWKKPE